MRRTLVVCATLLLLWTLASQLNHLLSGWRVHVFVGALYIVHAALMLPRRTGLISSTFAGLVCDATTPVVFGTHLLLFVAAHATVVHLRDRLPREDTLGRVVITLLLNLGLFLVFSFTQIHHSPAPAAIWPRLLIDLLVSQVLLSLITPWFLALQARALVLARVEGENFV